ncbi:hypothetical protein Leryth_016929 [Lithospermum erythrorhizon]|nr:hypothetical protein Leryth_016929 [Lithospermum erythrorhizon]
METRDRSQMTASDHAAYLQLIAKIKGLPEAEYYFDKLPDFISRKATCVPLLHAFVKEKSIDKAEALMSKICNSGLAVTPHSFNEMMKLYMATSQPEKVLSVIQLMKENQIHKNVLSYNLWMRACGETSGVESAEIVYKEMKTDKNVVLGWSSFCTLAEIYAKSGLVEQATVALRYAEDKMSLSSPLAYFFLITMYTSLDNKDEVLRLWMVVKGVKGRITCANYMSILVCFVKLGDIKEAEKIFLEWESQCKSYDVRVSNILLGAYARKGLMGKAESLHLRTLEMGGSPNFKTWEILMEGWIRCQRMDKVIHAMNRCFPNLKQCRWRPSPDILIAVAEYFEKTENFEDAAKYLQTIRSYGLASIPIYKSLLKMHLNANKPTKDILQLMLNDGIEMDDEIIAHSQTFDA